MAWNDTLTDLNYILGGLYPFRPDAYAVVTRAGIRPGNITMTDKAYTTWFSILDEADKQNKLPDLLKAALQDYPDDIGLNAALAGDTLKSPVGVKLDTPGKWKDDDGEEGYEKIIGKESTLLDIAFLEIGLERAKSVVRIELIDGSSGTGFLVDNNIIITNHHVIPDQATAKTCKVQFNFQNNAVGNANAIESFSLDPDQGFATSPATENDWTAVKLATDANTRWGALKLRENQTEKNRHVIIIQHPNGLYKQIAFYHNFVRFADDRVIQYLTDTQPGSSGAPVFDNEWNLIALHHSGGNIREPGTKRIVFRNEGIHINKVIEGLKTANIIS